MFEVQPGFQVERLFTVPHDELGSWVSLTFDDKGRLIVSDEGTRGSPDHPRTAGQQAKRKSSV